VPALAVNRRSGILVAREVYACVHLRSGPATRATRGQYELHRCCPSERRRTGDRIATARSVTASRAEVWRFAADRRSAGRLSATLHSLPQQAASFAARAEPGDAFSGTHRHNGAGAIAHAGPGAVDDGAAVQRRPGVELCELPSPPLLRVLDQLRLALRACARRSDEVGARMMSHWRNRALSMCKENGVYFTGGSIPISDRVSRLDE
jgi:hypothetical protein